MATTTEAERKYDVPGDFTLPDLSRLPAVAAVDEPRELRLDATYYDTAGLCLTAAHVTLRRRAGGHDAGWTVKRPAGAGDRTETSAPLTDPAAGVPDEVADQVRDLSGGEPLAPVAHIRTRRLERPLRRPDGTVRTVGPRLDRTSTGAVGEELHWLAGLLGAVRDGDVLADRLTEAVAAEPPENVVGPVSERIRERLGERSGTARAQLVEALDSDRYRRILDDLDQLAAGGLRAEERPATRRQLLKRARRAVRRADRRLAAADEAEPPDRDPLLHRSRRAYKRARYAAELVRPLAGKPAKRLVKQLTRLQDVLGTHQDAIVTGELLAELGAQAQANGENAVTYGLLRERQREAAGRSLDDLPTARDKAGRRKVRRWLKRAAG